jgi:FkbM family methyltransferase
MSTSTLVYVGASVGFGLTRILEKYSFSKVIAVEANPETFAVLKNRFSAYKHVHVVNTVLISERDPKSVTFYSTRNSVSSGLFEPPSKSHYGGYEAVTLKGTLLSDVLKEYGVNYIDLYISDLQGKDFEILHSISNYLNEKRIIELFIETHNGSAEIYLGAKNHLSQFMGLLRNLYRIDYISHDSQILKSTHDIVEFTSGISFGECDVHWSLRTSRNPRFIVS